LRPKGIELIHLRLTLLEQTILDSRYEFPVLYGVEFMTPVTGQEVIQRSTATSTATIPGHVDLRLMHSQLFDYRISFDLQLRQPALSEAKLPLA